MSSPDKKSPYQCLSPNSGLSSHEDRLPSMPSTTLQDFPTEVHSPNVFDSVSHHSLKKLSHFSEMKRSSDPALTLNLVRIEGDKVDETEPNNVVIELANGSDPHANAVSEEPAKSESPLRTIKRGLTIKAQNNYFVSENSFENESLAFNEIIENDLNFNYKVFFEFFAMHVLFYFFLGPFSSFLIALIWGQNLARNQFFWGLNSEFILQTLEFMVTFFVIFLYYFNAFSNIYMIEIYMIMASVLLRICIISIK